MMRFLVYFLVAAVLLLASIAALIGLNVLPEASFSFSGDGAKPILKSLGLPHDAKPIGSIEYSAQDGTLPEMASRRFTTGLNEAEIRDFYTKACQKAALSPPSEERLQMEPHTVCERFKTHGTTFVMAQYTCAANCSVFLQVRYFGK